MENEMIIRVFTGLAFILILMLAAFLIMRKLGLIDNFKIQMQNKRIKISEVKILDQKRKIIIFTIDESEEFTILLGRDSETLLKCEKKNI